MNVRIPFLLIAALLLAACGPDEQSSGTATPAAGAVGQTPVAEAPTAAKGEEADPPEVAIGERLFKETRFAQYFATHLQADDVNRPPVSGDPTVAVTQTTGTPLPGPFAGQSMSCAVCHLVDQHAETPGGGMRAYNDYARRSLLSKRADGRTQTVRNTPQMVGVSQAPPDHALFHFDGEFTSLQELAEDTLTGRMMGWLPSERKQAMHQIARVLREDDGTGALAQEFGGPYRAVLKGDASKPGLVLPEQYRVDVTQADDEAVLKAASRLLVAYMDSLQFARGKDGLYSGSPYDHFLQVNQLPKAPAAGESARDYARRLKAALPASPVWVDEGQFRHHAQRFVFGADELAGLKVFLAEQPRQGNLLTHAVGNCVACHTPPEFTDFGLHNTGISQREYDSVHGAGAFGRLTVPDASLRHTAARLLLPGKHLVATEPFRAIPAKDDPSKADLGTWNLVANPDFAANQPRFLEKLCAIPLTPLKRCDGNVALTLALATFKTPSLRDLGHSAPYTHAGLFDTLDDVVKHYRDIASAARAGRVRAGDPRLSDIALDDADVRALAAFLRALNEDYE